MKIYVFGNEDYQGDELALKIAKRLTNKIKGIEFVVVPPNGDLPSNAGQKLVLMDTVEGIDRIKLLQSKDIDSLLLSPRNSVHDFDLGFQIKYLKKLGKLKEVIIIGLPKGGEVNYDLIQSTFKKLVAQDMQGS